MKNEVLYATSGSALNKPFLKQVFEKYAEESITEEQVRRVLEPILRMIYEGRFDKRKPRKSWIVNPLGSTIAVAILILVVAIMQT